MVNELAMPSMPKTPNVAAAFEVDTRKVEFWRETKNRTVCDVT